MTSQMKAGKKKEIFIQILLFLDLNEKLCPNSFENSSPNLSKSS